ncbi:class I SAM-dependent rRNA methyltransferase [Elusimicrobiota bacterium]
MEKAIYLKKGRENRVLTNGGHLWVFSNEIESASDDITSGDIAEIRTHNNSLIGIGFINPKSLIAARIIARDDANVTPRFWQSKIERALSSRQRNYPHEKCYRAIFGESDGIPGLIVDKYDNYLVLEVVSKGAELEISNIKEALINVFSPKGILLRRDNRLRELEGMEMGPPEEIHGNVPNDPQRFEIDHLVHLTDLWKGHKTGFYFDQRDNRDYLKQWAKDKTVLDVYSYTGTFAQTLLKAGATHAVCVESGKTWANLGKLSAKANNLTSIHYLEADAQEYLKNEKQKFSIVIADPPNLSPTRKDKSKAIRKLTKVLTLACSRLEKGGLLAASTCSFHISLEDFRSALKDAAQASQRSMRVISERRQAQDHPVLLSMPETAYLKFTLLEAI